jgi:DNA transposition AAA+ family ATPase
MNDPEDITVDPEEMREWLLAEKARRSYSWSQMAAQIGVPFGTLSPFATGNYAGNKQRIAKEIFRYRQMLESQTERAKTAPVEPGYFETPTSRRIATLLTVAQSGRMTVVATGPGTGKTMTLRQYQRQVSNCWVATMKPSTKTLTAMLMEVLRSIGGNTKGGRKQQLSDQVADTIVGRHGVLVIDEANHLDLESLEEIRSWHDRPGGVGICLLGNEELLMRIQGGPRRDAFARLNSRIANSLIQNLPDADDVTAFCEAWGIEDSGMRALLSKIALTPGAGGLRECRQIVESAGMLAISEERPLSLADLRDAQSQRVTRHIRA